MSGTLNRAAHYLIHERLASGGMGEVYLGTMASPAGDRPVAVKQVATDHLQKQEAVERLIAEAKLGFQLRHANVCQVLDLVLGDRGAYLILEFVDGMNLRALVKSCDRRLEVPIALHAARETARALDYAHRARSGEGTALHLVHGDVTPQNILISIEGEVKLADFGISRALGMASPGSDLVGGTVGFMAPEIVSGSSDHRSDIYSLGATLHYALVGRAPNTVGDTSALDARGELSGALKRIVSRCLSPLPEERYSSAAELESQIAVEMARRFPEFTASLVSAKVRAARRLEGQERADPSATLFTIGSEHGTLSGIDDEPTRVDVPWLQPEQQLLPPHAPEGQAIFSPSLPPGLEMAVRTITPEGNATVTLGQMQAAPPRSHKHRRLSLALLLLGLAAAAAAALVFAQMTADESGALASGTNTFDASSNAVGGLGSDGRPSQFDAHPLQVASAVVLDAGVAQLAGDAANDEVVATKEPRPTIIRVKDKTNKPLATNDEAEPAFLSVNSTPWGAVEVDGQIVAQETPVIRFQMAPGRHRVTVVFGDGTRSKTRQVRLKSGQHQNLGFKQ